MSAARPFAQAGEALRAWMKSEGVTQSQLAQWAGVTRSMVSMWCCGAARPGAPVTLALGWIGATHPGAWLTPEERETAAEFHARAAEHGIRTWVKKSP